MSKRAEANNSKNPSKNGEASEFAKTDLSLPQRVISLVQRAWIHAPRSITQWGYAVLVLLSVASFATSISKGNLPAFIITTVIIFGLFIALWTFKNLSQSKDGFWQWFGKAAGLLVVGSMIGLFCSVMYYLALEQPAGLDRWFRPGYSVRSPSGLKVTPGAGLAAPTRVAQPRILVEGSQTAEPAASRRSSLTVRWDREVEERTNIEVSVKKQGEDAFGPPTAIVPGTQGVSIVSGLQSGTLYEIRAVAILAGRPSKPEFKLGATDAYLNELPPIGEYKRIYTGQINDHGQASDDTEATLQFVPRSNGVDRTVWTYVGSVKAGMPEGDGAVFADPAECKGNVCGSKCTGRFGSGQIIAASCGLNLDFVAGRMTRSPKREFIYENGARYDGQVVGRANDRSKPSYFIGPFPVWFSGNGLLVAKDGNKVDRYEGTWKDGALDAGKMTGSNGGVLSAGQEYTQTPCLLALTPSRGNSIGGYGARVTCSGIELGEWRGGSDVFKGLEITVGEDQLSSSLYIDGKRKRLDPQRYKPYLTCDPAETWGLPTDREDGANSDWRVSCEDNSAPYQCTLEAKAVDFTVVTKKSVNRIPDVLFRTSGPAAVIRHR